MMISYIDSDVILDVLLGRKDFVNDSGQILNLVETKKLKGTTTLLALANINYLLKRFDNKNALKAIGTLRKILTIIPLTDQELLNALESGFKDFEDAIQNYASENYGCNIIITRNIKDYAKSNLPIYTPKEYLIKHC
ncbi:MAG: putative nucleic acid-binding protein [Polaribacter sp.]|jgi:predicted nucleic acid-binding protein